MPRIFRSRVAAVLAPVPALLLLVPGLRAEEEGAAPHSSLQAFEALRHRVEASADGGQPDAATVAAVEELTFDLERELIRRDAEIAVLRLEAIRFDGEAQQNALDRLVSAAVARELAVIEHLRRLEGLAGMPSDCLEVPASALAETAAKPSTEKGKGLGFKISFEAEDSTEDPDP